MTLLVDTGVWLSSADADEPRHADCADLLRRHRGALVAPTPVIAETAWLIEARLGPADETRFLRLVINGVLRVVDLTVADYARCVALIDRYADMGLGLVDASVITVAENVGLTTIATLNQRDFRVVRPTHRDAFELVP